MAVIFHIWVVEVGRSVSKHGRINYFFFSCTEL
jgi:hypothetical protein